MKTTITSEPRAEFVQREFTKIARRYELMNQIMTFGSVNRWRKLAITQLQVLPGQIVLDLGAGGGQLTELVREAHPDSHVYPSDFTLGMMREGQATGLNFTAVDALALPYPSESVDRIICAFLLRNLEDYRPALQEILRVLKPGGRFVSLDTTPPSNKLLRPFIRLYMRVAIPLIGSLVTGQVGAYQYLIRSTEGFTPAETLTGELQQAGFASAGFQRLMLGTAAIHWAAKAKTNND